MIIYYYIYICVYMYCYDYYYCYFYNIITIIILYLYIYILFKMDRLESTYHFKQNYFKPWVFRQNHRANDLQLQHRAPVGSHDGIFGHQVIGFGHLGPNTTESLRKNPRMLGNHQWFHQWFAKLFFPPWFSGKITHGPQKRVETPEKSCGNHPIGEISRSLAGKIIEL